MSPAVGLGGLGLGYGGIWVRKAYSVAQRALKAVIASTNFFAQKNADPLGPAGSLTFSASAITPVSGRSIEITAEVTVATDTFPVLVEFDLVRDVTPIGPQAFRAAVANGEGGITGYSVTWIDTVPAVGVPHTYSIRVLPVSGEVSIDANQASITVAERPT